MKIYDPAGERDATPEEVAEILAAQKIAAEDEARLRKAAAEEPSPADKLTAFLKANPDIAAMLK